MSRPEMSPPELSNAVRNDPDRRAEVKVYDALRDQLPSGWLVFYSVPWLGIVRPNEGYRDGEVDFIVAHPHKGILFLEVKGGGIRYDGSLRQWYTRNRFGEEFPIDPFGQAMKNKKGWLGKLQTVPRLANYFIPLAHAVVFPDVERPRFDPTPEAPSDIIIGQDDLSRLVQRLEEILRVAPIAPWPDYGPQIVSEMKVLITRSIVLKNPLALAVREEDQELVRLTQEQYDLLGTLGYFRRAAIIGAAGTGKTFLAVEKARRMAAEGFRTLLTCFNNPLGLHLANVTANVPNLSTSHFHQLCRDMAEEAGLIDRSERVESDRLPDLLMSAMDLLPDRRFDAVIVDEGQDFEPEWWIALESCMREEKESAFYIFCDTHQTLYRGRGSLPPDLQGIFPLRGNVRNTRSICRVLEPHYQGEVRFEPRGPVGRTVEHYTYEGVAGLQRQLIQVLNRLLNREGFTPRDLVILTPRSIERSALRAIQIPGYTLVDGEPSGSREIRCSSVRRFKGLERLVSIVVELDSELPSGPQERGPLCYVGFSRARTHLILLGTSDTLPGLLPLER